MKKIFIIILLLLIAFSTSADEKINNDLQIALNIQKIFRNIADNVIPACVKIALSGDTDTFSNDTYNFFSNETQNIYSALGSGFLIHNEGFIITNYHVTEYYDESDLIVILNDGKEYKVKLIGEDKINDISLLKIQSEKKDFPFLTFTKTKNLQVGDIVIAVGSPFGLENTFTMGVVSAFNNSLKSNIHLIQSDVSLNAGSSGSPLVNLNSQIIGINSYIFTTSTGFEGISFAIPSEIVMNSIEELYEFGRYIGKFRRENNISYWLGATIKEIELEKEKKLIITDIKKYSPAFQYGIHKDDLILSVNTQKVDSLTLLEKFVKSYSLKKGVLLTLERKNYKFTLKIDF